MDQQLALLILGDLDPYPPNLTRQASPPPNVRRAGKRHNQALIALARRRSDVLYAMLRDGTLYQPRPAQPALAA